MLRKAFGILLAFIILTQSLMNLGLYAYYNLNKQMIIEKLCINKDKPQIHCNGHCYLSKQLKQAEENESKQSQALKEKEQQVLTFYEILNTTYIPQFSEIGFHLPFDNKDMKVLCTEIIPPPELAA